MIPTHPLCSVPEDIRRRADGPCRASNDADPSSDRPTSLPAPPRVPILATSLDSAVLPLRNAPVRRATTRLRFRAFRPSSPPSLPPFPLAA